MNENIFLVDDDKDMVAALEVKLAKEGFKVQTANDGISGLEKIRRNLPDLVVLDIDMPGKTGFDVCKSLKAEAKTKNVPIIMLTAMDEEIDRVLGLEIGADDYVTKPCNFREVILRIKSILRRIQQVPQSREQYEYGCLYVDLTNHEVKVNNEPIQLTLTEFKLLIHLAEHPGTIKTRDTLLEQIWEHGEGVFSRTIDTHIQRLRSKLKDAGIYIKTVRGVGYRFQE